MDDADVNDSYRAIGLYFVRFSRLVMRMRLLMGLRLTIGRDPLELVELAFAGAMAQQIADSFFSMCRFDAKLDDAELGVANVLRDAVNEQITHRNRFAHGDWWIGYDPAGGSAPELVRVTPKVRRGNFADLTTHPPDKLDQRSLQVEELVDDVTQFGMLALGIPMGRAATELNREYRVRDVYTFRPGKSGRHKQNATFTRDGPRAEEMERLGYRSP